MFIGLITTGIISAKRMLNSRILPWALFVYHLFFTLVYWHYTLSHPADSKGYFRSIGKEIPLRAGTQFIEWTVNRLDTVFSASYLDYFFLFQLAGFLGICVLYRIFKEILLFPTSKRTKQLLLLLVFLPNLHFWTTAIGKDSLIFLGITLVVWGLIEYRTRIPALFSGLVLVYFVRPHVAGFLVMAVLMALLWGPGVNIRWRIMGTVIVTGIFLYILPLIQDFLGLDEVTTKSVTGYLETRQGYNLEGGSSVDIRGYPLPLKILTYLYRPFFFDARGIMGLIVSVENVLYFLMTVIAVSRTLWSVLWRYKFSFFMRFNFFFFLIGTLVFSMSIANTGIAIRQKTMLMPSFMVLAVTVYAIKQYYAGQKSRENPVPGEPVAPETREGKSYA